MLLFIIFLTCCLITKAQYVTRTRFLIMDFPALFLVILAIYLYGIRPHFYIYTFKSKGRHSNKSYFAIFPSLHFLRQVQFIVIATTSTAARARLRRSFLGQSQFVGRLTFWGTVMLELKKTWKMLNILLFLCRPLISFFLQAFVPLFLNNFTICISWGRM